MALPTPKYYWNFNQSSGAEATDSVSGAKMTIDRPNFRPGKWGNALRFNADGGAHVVTTTVPDQAPPWTAAMWVLREEDAPSSALLGSSTYALKLEQWKDKHTLGVTRFSKQWPPEGTDHTFAASAPLKQWVHLTFVGTATAAKLYVNGVYVGTAPDPYGLGLQWIGSREGTTDDRAAMLLDEVKIFHEVLTDEQIKELYGMSPNPKLEVSIDKTATTSGSSTDLGTIANGQSKSVAITIKNTGQGKLTYTIDGTNAAGAFLVPADKDQAVAPGSTSAVHTLTFKSSKAGRVEATITIKSDDPDVPVFTYTVVATGQDAAPVVPVPPPAPVVPVIPPAPVVSVSPPAPKPPSPPTPPGMIYVLQAHGGRRETPYTYRALPSSGSFLDASFRTLWNGDRIFPVDSPPKLAAQLMVLNAGRGACRVKRFYIERSNASFACYAEVASRVLNGSRVIVDATSADKNEWTLGKQWSAFFIMIQWRGPQTGDSNTLFIETDDPTNPIYAIIL